MDLQGAYQGVVISTQNAEVLGRRARVARRRRGRGSRARLRRRAHGRHGPARAGRSAPAVSTRSGSCRAPASRAACGACPDDNRNARNFYLIVEAVDAGRPRAARADHERRGRPHARSQRVGLARRRGDVRARRRRQARRRHHSSTTSSARSAAASSTPQYTRADDRRRDHGVVRRDARRGGDLLTMIDRLLGDTKRELGDVDTRLAARERRSSTSCSQRELGVLAVLARVRVREIESGELSDALDDTGTRGARDCSRSAPRRRRRSAAEIDDGEQALAKLGEAAHRAASRRRRGRRRPSTRPRPRRSRQLAADAAYRARLDAATASDAVAALSRGESAGRAHGSRREGQAVRGRPAVHVSVGPRLRHGALRARRRSRACSTAGWRAIADFEPLRRDYWMLSELPARFDEHAKRMRTARRRRRGGRARARDGRGRGGRRAGARGRACEGAEEALAGVDRAHRGRRKPRSPRSSRSARAFASGEDDLSRRCHAAALRHVSAARRCARCASARRRTPNPEDDAAVDELTAIRADLPRVDGRGRALSRAARHAPRSRGEARGRTQALQGAALRRRDVGVREQRADRDVADAAARPARSACPTCGTR